MYANVQSLQTTSAVEIARLLVHANQCYRASNDPHSTPAQRASARDDARRLLAQVTAAEPRNGAALNLLGRLAMDCNALDEAHALFLQSLDAEPNNAQTHTNLGYWALLTGDAHAAEGHFTAALQHDTRSAAAFCGIAHAKREQGEYAVAWLHYRQLLDLGHAWPSVFDGMVRCAEFLTVEQANPALATDVLRLLAQDGLPYHKLGRLATGLLHAQYDLSNPDAPITLNEAADDNLLILALQKTLLTDPDVEDLVTLLRTGILEEVAHTGSLRDELQPLALAIGHYGERTGYVLLASEEENAWIASLNSAILEHLKAQASPEDLAGAVIVSAMYGALFQQVFAVELGRFERNAWPLAMQDMLGVSFYDKADDEAYKLGFDEKKSELVLAGEDVAHAWPHWTNLDHHNVRPLREELQHSLRIPVENLPETLRVLVVGASSGQKALEMARYFSDVEVIAVDEDLANLAYGARKARELGLENIVFWPWSLASQFIADGHPVHYVELSRMPSAQVTVSVDALIRQALASGGVLHVNSGSFSQDTADQQICALIDEHQLAPTAENLRALRRLIMNSRNEGPWDALLTSDDFYAAAGCRRRWFQSENRGQTQALLDTLANEMDWKLVKAKDADGEVLASQPVQEQLRAQRLGKVQSLIGQGIHLYFRRRR